MKMFKNICITVLGAFILAFALYNIHSVSNITEGGVLGLALFFENMFGVSPAISSLILNIFCYTLGWRTLGKKFLFYSAVATVSFSIIYKIFEQFDPVFPQIVNHPLLAAVFGAALVGIGVGLCVRIGGAPTGDDALAMSLSKLTKLNIRWVYLISDLTVLSLSLFYIPIGRICYSLITVIISGQIIGFIQKRDKEIA